MVIKEWLVVMIVMLFLLFVYLFVKVLVFKKIWVIFIMGMVISGGGSLFIYVDKFFEVSFLKIKFYGFLFKF